MSYECRQQDMLWAQLTAKVLIHSSVINELNNLSEL